MQARHCKAKLLREVSDVNAMKTPDEFSFLDCGETGRIDLRQNLYSSENGELLASRHAQLRLLFLDVDGVLNCTTCRNMRLMPPKLQLLGQIVRQVRLY